MDFAFVLLFSLLLLVKKKAYLLSGKDEVGEATINNSMHITRTLFYFCIELSEKTFFWGGGSRAGPQLLVKNYYFVCLPLFDLEA